MAKKQPGNSTTKNIIEGLRKPPQTEELVVTPRNLLSTGSTLLNLACSGKPCGGFVKGTYNFIVGDSSSGKTFWVLTTLAEASINRRFDDYRLIYNCPEFGALMDLTKFFGPGVASRLEAPDYDADGHPQHSLTVDEFYYDLDNKFNDGRPFIYILDSMDGLRTVEDNEKFQELKKAAETGDETTGSYGMSKAKKNSENLPWVTSKLAKTGSMLFIISQTRDQIKPGSYNPKTRAGGHALRFYAAIEMWTSKAKELTRTVNGKERQIGIQARVRIEKNRVSGKNWDIEVPLYFSMGIDDVGSCVDYLIDEKRFTKPAKGTQITAEDFGFVGTRDALIKYIQDNDLERDLQDLVADTWREIEAKCQVHRKSRYGAQAPEEASGD